MLEGPPVFGNTEAKLLRTLETAADHCDRLDDLVDAFAALAPDEPKFHGRINRVKKRMR